VLGDQGRAAERLCEDDVMDAGTLTLAMSEATRNAYIWWAIMLVVFIVGAIGAWSNNR